MRNRFHILALLGIVLYTGPTWAATLDCEALKPKQPLDEQMKNTFEVKGQGAGWLKALGSLSVKDDYQKLYNEQHFDNPDEANLRQSFVYLFCGLLKDSSASDDVKATRYQEVVNLLQEKRCPQIMINNSDFTGNGVGIEVEGCVYLSGSGNKFNGNGKAIEQKK